MVDLKGARANNKVRWITDKEVYYVLQLGRQYKY